MSRVFAALALGLVSKLPVAAAAKTEMHDLHALKKVCLQEDPQLKGKALRTCIKAKRGKLDEF